VSAFLDHFQKPRNVGDLATATGRARVENPVCGDVLTLALSVVDGKITAVRFRCEGCSGSIAAASAASELATGRTLADARNVSSGSIEDALDGLPQLKRHGADLAAEALLAAIQNHEEGASS
jgi:nitrogen fixation NifU-like protein